MLRKAAVLVGLSGPGYLLTLAATWLALAFLTGRGMAIVSPVVIGDAAGITLNVCLFPWYWRVCHRFGLIGGAAPVAPSSVGAFAGRAGMMTVSILPGYLANLASVALAATLLSLGGPPALPLVVAGDVVGASVNIALFDWYHALCLKAGLVVTREI